MKIKDDKDYRLSYRSLVLQVTANSTARDNKNSTIEFNQKDTLLAL